MRTVRLEFEGDAPAGVSDASTGRRVPPPLLIDVRIAERGCDATATLSHLAPEDPDGAGEPAVAIEEARVLIDRPAAALLFAMIRVRAGKPPPPLSLTMRCGFDAGGRMHPDPAPPGARRRRAPRGVLLGGGPELPRLLFARPS